MVGRKPIYDPTWEKIQVRVNPETIDKIIKAKPEMMALGTAISAIFKATTDGAQVEELRKMIQG